MTTHGRPVALTLALAASLFGCEGGAIAPDADAITCAPVQGTPSPLGAARLFFEYNATDEDTGLQAIFDASGWSELCVTGPDGAPLVAFKPQAALREFNLGAIFFESREPNASEVPQADVLARFPPGPYTAFGTSFDGGSLRGTATLTHDLPAAPAIVSPADGAEVDPANLVVEWTPVTQTVAGTPATIVGYEVIVTNEDADGEDPNGMSQPIASLHVRPSVSRVTIPSEFLEPGTAYELEVIAIEASGNQTITVQFFDTP
jgi:hypothetical protein